MSADRIRTANLPTYIADENPTCCPCCPFCGARTQFMKSGEQQLHWCLDVACGAVFVVESDEEGES